MIAHISGTIVEKFSSSVIVDVHGVGYELTLTSLDYDQATLDSSQKFYTFHSIRENSEELYGFSSLAAKKLFELLLSVNGIGPKAAIAILSLAPPETVRSAIASADTAFVSRATGVGKKSAERVIVDLRDKVGSPSSLSLSSTTLPSSQNQNDEALDALIALGFPLKEATLALSSVDSSLPVEERIRLALKK